MSPKIIKIGDFRLRKKMAIFDFDWTLVRPKTNGTFSKNVDDWMWLTDSVPMVLKKLYSKGFCIVVISNQSRTTEMKITQITNVMSSLGDIPSLIAVGYEESDKKPNTTMFDIIKEDKQVDMVNSFYVGDALGRPEDWSDSDKKFAENIGLAKIYSPDDMFEIKRDFKMNIPEADTQEVIVMVGYPGSGKSTIASQFSEKYKVLEGDILKTSANMIKEAKKYIKEGYSVIFDATNPTIKKRKEYIDVAKKYGLHTRCILMQTDMIESMFRNNRRNKVIPKVTYFVYRKKYEEPTINEGFDEIIRI
ncbi:HAD-IIIA family hydrolase [bacterium]|nr:HAD-IIIA family hydrolase [bacterium]